MKVIFLGTPDFSVNTLRAIVGSNHTIVGVVTQPDRVNGRGNAILPSPVKTFAVAHGLPLFQFQNISREGETVLAALQADVMVTAAYGQILRQNILDLCPLGILNVHASLLPKYRGSSPVQWAIANGEKELGVTIMKTVLKVDAGDILMKQTVPLPEDANGAEALEKLSVAGGGLCVKALDALANGTAVFAPQVEDEATHCRMLKKEDGALTFDQSADAVVNFVRGMNPWPGAFVHTENGILKILKARKVTDSQWTEKTLGERTTDGKDINGMTEERELEETILSRMLNQHPLGSVKPGTVLCADRKKGLIVSCGCGVVEICTLKPENGKEMQAKAYLLGKKITVGSLWN